MIKVHPDQHKLSPGQSGGDRTFSPKRRKREGVSNLPGISVATHEGEVALQSSLVDKSLRWVVGIRYKIAFLLFAMLIVAYSLGLIPTGATIKLALTGFLYLLTSAFYSYTLRKPHDPSSRLIPIIRNLQVPELLFLATTATYYFGGVLSPLFVLFPLAILQAIILLQPAGVYRTGAAAVALYCGLALLEISGQGQPGVLPGGFSQHLSLPAVANSSTYALYVAIVSSVLLLTAYMGNRVALLIRQRNQQIETQLKDSQTLYDVANKLGNMMDEADMLAYLATTLNSLDNASMCLVGLFNKDGNLEIKASAGAPPNVTSRLHGITSSSPALADLFQRGMTLVINDIHQHPPLKQLALKSAPHSVYIFPIKAEAFSSTPELTGFPLGRSKNEEKGKETVIGGISLSFDTVKPLSQELSGLMTTITTQAALAIQRAQLVADARRLANEMSQLYNLGLYTGSTLSKDEVVRRTSDNIESLMKPDAYYIALYDQANDLLSFEVFVEHGRQMGKLKMPLDGGGITSQIIRSGKPLLVQDWSENGEYNNLVARKLGDDMLSYLGVPMLWEDRVIGVISVQCEEAMSFDAHDERLLMALAAQTAMALENAKLHQLAQDQGKLDSLTLVYNHGYFVELVRNAVAQSDTDDSQVALIMLDIDHFKQYNDSFGHVAGDNVLKMVAQALKNSVRETDAVGRWGGEEFGVLLLGVGVTEAKKIARQARRTISELSPENAHGQVLPNPTISQGISSYPYPSATANDLIEEADTALYHAKKHGRNQLVVYEAAGGMKDDTTTTGHLMRTRAAQGLRITTGSLGRSRRGKQLDERAVTTNDLAHSSEGTTPQLTPHNELSG